MKFVKKIACLGLLKVNKITIFWLEKLLFANAYTKAVCECTANLSWQILDLEEKKTLVTHPGLRKIRHLLSFHGSNANASPVRAVKKNILNTQKNGYFTFMVTEQGQKSKNRKTRFGKMLR